MVMPGQGKGRQEELPANYRLPIAGRCVCFADKSLLLFGEARKKPWVCLIQNKKWPKIRAEMMETVPEDFD